MDETDNRRVVITVRIVDSQRDAVKSEAAIRGDSMNQWVSEAIRQRLERDLLSLD